MNIIKIGILGLFLTLCARQLVQVVSPSLTNMTIQLGFTLTAILMSLSVLRYMNRPQTTHYFREPYVVTVDIQHHIFRVPLEDQVDLDIDDRHNVHNKTLKRGASKALKKLKKLDRQVYTIESALTQIKEVIGNTSDPALQQSASEAIEAIEMMDAHYSSAKIDEREIIRLVWERINHPDNLEQRDLLIDTFIQQLADCRRGPGGVHCCEGRIMRMLQTLQLNDHNSQLVDLKPLWAYQEEITNKILKYRAKLLAKAPSEYRVLDEKLDLNDNEEVLMKRFNQCLIRNLDKRFDLDYVRPGLLKKEEIKDLTQAYYAHL